MCPCLRDKSEHKGWEVTKRGTFGPGGYKMPPACGPPVLSTRTSGRSCTFGHADRDVFARLYRGSGGVIDGWFPIYDPLEGVRGELRLSIKLNFIDFSPNFKHQLC